MPLTAVPVIRRLLARVVKLPDGCWRWTGSFDRKGYGKINVGPPSRKIRLTHVLTYEHKHGPVPEGLQLDHLCRNRWCCNPDHVEPVTGMVNMHRGQSPNILLNHAGVCKRGHPQGPGKTHYYTSGPKAGLVAFCLECRREKRRAGGWK